MRKALALIAFALPLAGCLQPVDIYAGKHDVGSPPGPRDASVVVTAPDASVTTSRDAGLFAPGELAQRHVQLLLPEQEPRGPAAHVYGAAFVVHVLAVAAERPLKGVVQVQLGAVLVEGDHAQAVGLFAGAGIGRQLAGQHFKQGGFA